VDYGAALEMRFGATRRGFESRPLRHLRHPREREWVRWSTPVLTHGRWSPLASVLIARLPLRARAGGWRSMRLADWVPSDPSLRSSRPPSPERPSGALEPVAQSEPRDLRGRRSPSAVDSPRRARRGTSGALYLQTAPAGLNSHPRSPFSRAAASSDVEDRVPRSGESRTVSGPEGSSTKRTSSGAAERPGPSRSLRWARKRSGRRWVHGVLLPSARDRTGAL
jgi:hypothetical protein